MIDSDESSDDEAALIGDAMLDQLQETHIMERHNSYVKDWEVQKVDIHYLENRFEIRLLEWSFCHQIH